MNRHMIRPISIAVLFTLILATIAAAQAATTVRGRVLAVDGTPYPSASVTLERPAGAVKRVFSDRDGMFYISGIAPGAYTLRVKTSRSERTFPVTARAQAYSDIAPVTLR
jgi:hypothetical protein